MGRWNYFGQWVSENNNMNFKLLDKKYIAWNNWVIEHNPSLLGKLPFLVNPNLSNDRLDALAFLCVNNSITHKDLKKTEKLDCCGIKVGYKIDFDDLLVPNIQKVQKKEKNMVNKVKVNWKQPQAKDVVYFKDLGYEAFRIKGWFAVYLKVHVKDKYLCIDDCYTDLMLEIATGNLFIPTQNPVERVTSEINVDLTKPYIYI